MKNYNIEGGLDFFSELYKSIGIEDETEKVEEQNLCLITNQPLIDKFVTMCCGHKFNYVPLYLDIKNHKQKFNVMEGSSSRLNRDEIRCPYCRQKQKGVLPYYQDLGLPKIHGVNYINVNINVNSSYNYKTCQYLTPNKDYEPNGIDPVDTNPNNCGNCKYFVCFKLGTQMNLYNGISDIVSYEDDNYYCDFHKKQVVKKYKKESIEKLKKEAKEKEKELKKQKKLEEKEKLKSAKLLKNSAIYNDNVVLGPSNITDISGNIIDMDGVCKEILKSGSKAGLHCGCKLYKDNICKRHYNLKCKS